MPYNANLHTPLNKPIGLNGLPLDARSMFYVGAPYREYRPFSDANNFQEVKDYLVTAKNKRGGFDIFVNVGGTMTNNGRNFIGGEVKVFWFADGINLTRKGGDVSQETIDQIVSQFNQAIEDLTTAVAGKAAQGSLNAEIESRASADAILDQKITSANNLRAQGDAALQEQVDGKTTFFYVDSKVQAEASARIQSDNDIKAAATSETNARVSADQILTADLLKEIARAVAIETSLASNISLNSTKLTESKVNAGSLSIQFSELPGQTPMFVVRGGSSIWTVAAVANEAQKKVSFNKTSGTITFPAGNELQPDEYVEVFYTGTGGTLVDFTDFLRKSEIPVNPPTPSAPTTIILNDPAGKTPAGSVQLYKVIVVPLLTEALAYGTVSKFKSRSSGTVSGRTAKFHILRKIGAKYKITYTSELVNVPSNGIFEYVPLSTDGTNTPNMMIGDRIGVTCFTALADAGTKNTGAAFGVPEDDADLILLPNDAAFPATGDEFTNIVADPSNLFYFVSADFVTGGTPKQYVSSEWAGKPYGFAPLRGDGKIDPIYIIGSGGGGINGRWAGKTKLTLGTSLEYGWLANSYPNVSSNLLGMTEINNAYPGSRIVWDAATSPFCLSPLISEIGAVYPGLEEQSFENRLLALPGAAVPDVIHIGHAPNDMSFTNTIKRGELPFTIKTGSIQWTQGSAIITGTGTQFLTAGQVQPEDLSVPTLLKFGDFIYDVGGNLLGQVLSVQSNTQLTLKEPVTRATLGAPTPWSRTNLDRWTFYGAYNFIITQAYAAYPGVSIVMSTPHILWLGTGFDPATYEQMRSQVLNLAFAWKLPVHDQEVLLGLNPHTKDGKLYDNIHPTEAETALMGYSFAKFLDRQV